MTNDDLYAAIVSVKAPKRLLITEPGLQIRHGVFRVIACRVRPHPPLAARLFGIRQSLELSAERFRSELGRPNDDVVTNDSRFNVVIAKLERTPAAQR